MKKSISLSLIIAASSITGFASDTMKAMVGRLLPGHEDSFVFEQIGSPYLNDWYRVESFGDKILISGNSNNSMAVGPNRYLMNECKTYVSWWASDSIAAPEVLPLPAVPLSGKARVADRFFSTIALMATRCLSGRGQVGKLRIQGIIPCVSGA